MKPVTGVFTLLTITIGEELDSRFFEILACVSIFAWLVEKLQIFLALIYPPLLGIVRNLRPCVACNCFGNYKRLCIWRNVLRTMSGNESVPKKADGTRNFCERFGGQGGLAAEKVELDSRMSMAFLRYSLTEGKKRCHSSVARTISDSHSKKVIFDSIVWLAICRTFRRLALAEFIGQRVNDTRTSNQIGS